MPYLTPQYRPVSGAPGVRRPRGRRVRPLLVLGGLPCLPQAGGVYGRHCLRAGDPHDEGAPQGKPGFFFRRTSHPLTHPHTHTQHTNNLFQVRKKEKKKVLFIAPAERTRVRVQRERLREGGSVLVDHIGKRYKGKVTNIHDISGGTVDEQLCCFRCDS